ncbi:MAG: hypothetical protein QW507_01005 [Candidatus Nanoarchaeia archaeon]|nr:hypothetical protein [Candidatus Haiyanarchaeum thermophilum]MCW1303393.1 hypothetical protein [Candidatus Haiyanarchaeum thermophilum]MCW1303919.1 hypothetical protein [Candidatus Haiyanarchaeum thermophilum]MCW1306755.1 hypothetical protein [Candidatus Haiyanarchaeum thermophilum]MCW1307420.1 hypothetical protein [Candidatus Haiyanarchaeum thermophilum]
MGEIKFILQKEGPSLYKIGFLGPENALQLNVDLIQQKLILSYSKTNPNGSKFNQTLTWHLSGNFSLESSENLPNLEKILTPHREISKLEDKISPRKLPYLQVILEEAKQAQQIDKRKLLARFGEEMGKRAWIIRVLRELKQCGIVREVDVGVYKVEKLKELENLCKYGAGVLS